MHMNGTPTARETKTFDVVTGQTVTIRSKEGAVDYRFMPEPDLPPVVLNEAVGPQFSTIIFFIFFIMRYNV